MNESSFEQLVDIFSASWQAGVKPSLQQFLQQSPESSREQLLEKLLPIDVGYRLKADEVVDPGDYLAFGDRAQTLAEELLGQQQASSQSSRASDQPAPTAIDAEPAISSKSDAPVEDPLATEFPTEFGTEFPIDADSESHVDSTKQIGRYKLLQQIGEGGMGTVWMAEQEKPVRRRVALKLIKGAMADKQVIARFEAERQALAMMDHQNIAKVLDAGTTEIGSPFFVMELVNGIPINEYCDRNRLTPDERLKLFATVCKAVQHAHQKGIIHRDLKPSNVLVQISDGQPVAKVIDFGLAKALQHQTKLTDKTMFTEFGQVVGTLQYMSPEQAMMDALNVDTRSDIYSLGVMLYELLAGSTPIERETLRENALLKVLEEIREMEPPKPSHRLSSTGEKIRTISELRQIQPGKLQQILRGELDWIIMKALDKDRTRRYETANDFAADITNYLNGDTVAARPPSTAYRLQKFVHKNKGLFASLAAIMLLLLAGIAGTSYGLIQANRKTDEAKFQRREADKQKQVAISEKERAEQSAKRSKDALKIFTDSFRSVNPNQGNDADMLAKDVLYRAKGSLENSELDDEGKAEILVALTDSFLGVGEYNSAVETAKAEFAIRKTKLGPDHPDTLTSMNNLANSYFQAVKTDQALKLNQEILELRKTKLGTDHPDTLTSMNNLANSYLRAGKTDQALKLNQELLELRKTKLGTDHPDTLTSMANLAVSYAQAGKTDQALKLDQEVLELRKTKLGPDHPDTLMSMANLARSYAQAGKTDQALKLDQEVLELSKTKLGPDHPDTLTFMGNLAASYVRAGKTDQAVKLFREVLELQKTKLGPDHPNTLMSMNNLAFSYAQAGKTDQSLKLDQEVLELRKTKLGPDHPDTLTSMNNLAFSYSEAGKTDQAMKLFQEVPELLKTKLGPDHPNTLMSMNNLAFSYRQAGQTDQAVKLGQEVLELQKTKLGPDHPDTLNSKSNLAASYLAAGQSDKAVKLNQEVLKLRKTKLGPDHPDTLKTISNLADSYRQAGQSDKAVKLNQEVLKLRKNKLGPDHPDTLASMNNLADSYREVGQLLLDEGDFVEAEITLQRCYDIRKEKFPEIWTTDNAQSLLGAAQLGLNKTDAAALNLNESYKKLKARVSPTVKNKYLTQALDRLIELAKVTENEEDLKKWTAEKGSLDQQDSASK